MRGGCPPGAGQIQRTAQGAIGEQPPEYAVARLVWFGLERNAVTYSGLYLDQLEYALAYGNGSQDEAPKEGQTVGVARGLDTIYPEAFKRK